MIKRVALAKEDRTMFRSALKSLVNSEIDDVSDEEIAPLQKFFSVLKTGGYTAIKERILALSKRWRKAVMVLLAKILKESRKCRSLPNARKLQDERTSVCARFVIAALNEAFKNSPENRPRGVFPGNSRTENAVWIARQPTPVRNVMLWLPGGIREYFGNVTFASPAFGRHPQEDLAHLAPAESGPPEENQEPGREAPDQEAQKRERGSPESLAGKGGEEEEKKEEPPQDNSDSINL